MKTIYATVLKQLCQDLGKTPEELFLRAVWVHKTQNITKLYEMHEDGAKPLALDTFFYLVNFIAEQYEGQAPELDSPPDIPQSYESYDVAPNLYAVTLERIRKVIMSPEHKSVTSLLIRYAHDLKLTNGQFAWLMGEFINPNISAQGFMIIVQVYMVIWSLNDKAIGEDVKK